jgi:hypothetical protein
MFLAILGILSFLDNCRVDAVHAPGRLDAEVAVENAHSAERRS